MSILARARLEIKLLREENIILRGPKEIPSWHPFYKKKCWKCGHYVRKIILYDKTIISIRIYRYYCVETGETQSILPFYIQRYERFINTVIEDVIKGFFLEKCSAEQLSDYPAPSPWTTRRWIRRFKTSLNNFRQNIEEYLIKYHPSKLVAATYLPDTPSQINDLFTKAKLIAEKYSEIEDFKVYGNLSFCYLAQSSLNKF